MTGCTKTQMKLCEDYICEICFERSFASVEKAIYWSDKNEFSPRELFKSVHDKYKFDCAKCNHEFESTLSHVNHGTWCPYCANRRLCDSYECSVCYNNSFASVEEAIYWSDKNECSPREVCKNSKNKYKFDCAKCNHEFESNLNNINNGRWCSYCCIPSHQLCESYDCSMCYNNSFASHEKSKFWSVNNNISPREVFKNSNNKYKFDCDKCTHEFESVLASITSGSWCPYCYNRQLCDSYDCSMCYNNSFASHEKSKFWSDKNNISPREVSKNSNNKYKFDCDKCTHEFESVLASITSGSWCSICKNKTELKVFNFLATMYSYINRQAKFEWCRSLEYNRFLPFDMCISSFKILLELDGPQHFEDVAFFRCTADERRKVDHYKQNLALENGYSVIRIVQEHVWADSIEWKEALIEQINFIRQKNIPNVYCISGDDRYIKWCNSE